MPERSLLDQLIDALRCLPGVGPKSAQRMAFHLLERDREGGRRLARVMAAAMERVFQAIHLYFHILQRFLNGTQISHDFDISEDLSLG